MRDLLEVPLQLSGIQVQRNNTIRVEIGSLAGVAVEIGGRIADSPVDRVQGGIERAGHPGGAAAILPTVAAPGLVPFFAGAGDGPELPGLASRLHIEGGQIASVSRIAAGDAD